MSEQYKMVPLQPTDEMYRAVRDWSQQAFGKPIGNPAASGCWATMLAAAPEQPSSTEPLDREALLPEGWRIVERSTCYALLDGSTVAATLAGPDAKQNAAIIANALKSQPAQPSDSQSEDAGHPTLTEIAEALETLLLSNIPIGHKAILETAINALKSQSSDSQAQLANKQRVLTDEQILAIGAFGQSPLKRLEHGRAIESALLSKLRGATDSQAEVSDTALLDWCEKYNADITEHKQGTWKVTWFSDEDGAIETEMAYQSPREAIKAAMRTQEGE